MKRSIINLTVAMLLLACNAGDRLSFATMLVQSNDLFFGPVGMGIELFDGEGQPLSGDVTEEVFLWDAGTEVNQEPAIGGDQAPRQSAPDTGGDEDGQIRPIVEVDDGFTYPPVSAVLRVTISTR